MSAPHAVSSPRLDANRYRFPPADMQRLARYLHLPGKEEIDDATAEVIEACEAERDSLIKLDVRTAALSISERGAAHVLLEGGRRMDSSAGFCRELSQTDADKVVVAAISLGSGIDARIRGYFEQEALLEAFVTSQWASVMIEQARSWMTHSLCGWADAHGRALMPYNGPGYNNWDLMGMCQLFDILEASSPDAMPVAVNESGMLTPSKSMMLVYALAARASARSLESSLIQCSRCAMRGCAYRVTDMQSGVEVEISDMARTH